MHAMALEHLEQVLQEGAAALDVGAGSGYLMACMAVMVGAGGTVVGIEHVPQLTELAVANLNEWNPQLAQSGLLDVRAADGREGAPDKVSHAMRPFFIVLPLSAIFTYIQRVNLTPSLVSILPFQAPFMAIHVGAAAPTIPPALIDQLAPGGVMVIPVGPKDYAQSLQVIRKDATGRITEETVCGVRYVPLCDLSHQLEIR